MSYKLTITGSFPGDPQAQQAGENMVLSLARDFVDQLDTETGARPETATGEFGILGQTDLRIRED